MLERFRNSIKKIKDLKFEDIVSLAQLSVPDEIYEKPYEYFHQREKDRGARPIDEELGIVCYLSAYAKIHRGKLHLAFEHLNFKDICSNSINIVDWGCGQGLATFVLLDYLKKNGIHCDVENIILIEPSELAIEYAKLYLTQRLKGTETKIRAVNKYFNTLEASEFEGISRKTTIHLYSNILDVEGLNMKELTSWLKFFPAPENYIISVSPKYYSGDVRINTFFSYLNEPRILWSCDESNKVNNIYNINATLNIRVAKLLSESDVRLKKIKFYSPRQFFAGYALDSIWPHKKFIESLSAFDVYAPYEIGTSYMDNVDPIYAVLSNIISRGLPTKASPYVEDIFLSAFEHSTRCEKFGSIFYNLSNVDLGDIIENINQDNIEENSLLVLSPVAIARIQKTVIEALITGHLTVEQEYWDVVVDEDDIPCAAIAFKDLQMMFDNIVLLSEDYSHRKFPKVRLDVINNKYYKSPLHLDATVYKSPSDVKGKIYDLVIDYSRKKYSKEYTFAKYNVKTDCYYAIYTATSVTAQRYIYTTDLINYKTLSSTDSTGNYINNEENLKYLEYFLQLIFRKISFRLGQLPILNRALKNKSVIGLLPTGGGKSLTYQLAAMLQPGVTLVIDPLRSLMQDQYDGLITNGIDCCTYLNGAIGPEERSRREYQIEHSQCLFAFMSPERLCIYSFRKRLQNMYDLNVYFSYGVIDEVHCVSEWGQDFRFTYLHLGRNLYNYVRAKNGVVTLFGLTATASFDVLADVERELSGNGAYNLDSEALVRCEDTNRLELQYRIIPVPVEFNHLKSWNPKYVDPKLPKPYNIEFGDKELGKSNVLNTIISGIPSMARELMEDDNIQRIVSSFYQRQGKDIDPNVGQLLKVDFPDDFASPKKEYNQAGIVFCPHRRTTEVSVDTCASKICEEIPDTGIFYSVDDNNRDSDQKPMQNMVDFREDKLAIMVATKAFGMGIDKPNVRFTINVNYSNSLEAYVQEAGRAGRDRSIALAIILVSDYNFVSIKRSCDLTYPQIKDLKGKWFKPKDLDEILEYYRINLDKERWLDHCSPATDLVSIKCEKNDKEAFHKPGEFMECECVQRAGCKLVELKKKLYSWHTHDELVEEARKLECTLVGRNIHYQSPDYQNMMYFYGKGFPGVIEEKKIMHQLMSQLDVSSFIGDTVEINKETIVNHKGFLDLVLEQEPGTEIVTIINYDTLKDDVMSKAIYRMCCIGFIDDFTKDYNANKYRIVCIRKKDGDYFRLLKDFLMRYYPENKAENEVRKAMEMRGNNEVQKCLAYLTDFIYEKLAVKKKRAIDDIRSFCNVGLNSEKDWKEVNEDLKDYIYYYFNSKFAKEDYVAENGEPYSLTVDTSYGKEAPVDIVYKYLKVVDEEICGPSGNPNDNVKHLQGAVRLIMRSLTRENPVIDLLNVFCILVLREYKRNNSIKADLERSYANAYYGLSEEFSNRSEFYNYITCVKNDMFLHGADKEFASEMELIEINTEISRHNDFLKNLNWKLN